MGKVSTDGMTSTANEIKSLVDVLKQSATKTATGAEKMSQAASILTSYNGQTVQGTVINTNAFDGKHTSHYKEYQTWIINTNGIETTASSVASKADSIATIAEKVSSETDVINAIAEQIDGYIATIQSTLGNNISATSAATALKALGQNSVNKSNLAVSGDLVNNRDFLDYDQISKDPNLQGGALTFEKQEDGTYKVLKNGGGTGYYTTGLAAAFYMKTLERANNQLPLSERTISKYDENSTLTEKAGDEMVQKYKEQQTTSTDSKINNVASYINELEQKEQYTYDSQRVYNNETSKLYKGQSGGYKIVEPTSDGGSHITYYDKNNTVLHDVTLNQNGDTVVKTVGD